MYVERYVSMLTGFVHGSVKTPNGSVQPGFVEDSVGSPAISPVKNFQ
jgi:hypothetical protein